MSEHWTTVDSWPATDTPGDTARLRVATNGAVGVVELEARASEPERLVAKLRKGPPQRRAKRRDAGIGEPVVLPMRKRAVGR